MKFENKTALVTGGSKGMGGETVRGLVREGAAGVLIADIDEAAGKALAEELNAEGGNVVFCRTDIVDPVSVENAVKTAVETFGKLDILANVAGIGEGYVMAADIPLEEWDKMIAVNLSGVFYFTKYALPHLLETKGNIVNVASMSGLVGTYQVAAYVAAKHGVVGLTRAVAYDYATPGVRCNAICPGPTETSFWVSLPKLSPEERAKVVEKETGPVKRFAKPEEMANAILFLASEDASYITGAILPVDGGYTAV